MSMEMNEIRKAYTKEAGTYDKVRFESKGGKYRFKVERLKLLNHLKGPKILELGAGTGRYGLFFAKLGFEYTGIDITPKMLEVAKEKAEDEGVNIKLLEMDAHKLGFKKCTFDSVFCDRTFKFFQDPIKVLEEAYRVLKPNGKMIVNAETPKMFTTHWTKNPLIIHIVEGLSRHAKTGHSSKCPPSVDKISEEVYTEGKMKFYTKEKIIDMFKKAKFKKTDVEELFYFPAFMLQFVPSHLLDQLLTFEVKSKRGVLGSKAIVVGEKI